MTSQPSAYPGVKPRTRLVPEHVSSAGQEAIELAASAGLFLDEWQSQVVIDFLAERADGKWAALECGLIVPRQNGKSRALEAIALHSLFLDPDARLTLWSAHQFKTAREAFRNIQAMCLNFDHLSVLVKSVRASHGEEGIELKDGSRLNFVARSRTSGRGFSGDKLILDEAQEIDPEDIASSLPMLAARPNPQIIYAGTVNDSADHLRKVRDRAEVGDETRLAVTEFGSDVESDINDEAVWAAANPSYATRLDPEFVAMERKSMSDEAFRQERLGIWPPKASEVTVFPAGAWEACINLDSSLNGLVVLAADAPPDRSEAYVTAAGLSDNSFHVEVIEAKRGLGWVSDFLIEKATRYNALVVIDGRSALGTIVPKLEQAGVKVYLMNAADVAKACGSFYDMVVEERLAHLDDPILNLAVFGASQRALGDAWAWDRKHALVAISPLIAATNALYGMQLQGAASGEPEVYFI